MNLASLVRNWWMMAIRGALAIAFGVSIVVWPSATVSLVVLLFSVYAILDGAWTIGAGTRASTRVFDAWPVLLEGAVSVGLGLVALAWPFVPRQFVHVLAAWGWSPVCWSSWPRSVSLAVRPATGCSGRPAFRRYSSPPSCCCSHTLTTISSCG
jgi:hypothetical protein